MLAGHLNEKARRLWCASEALAYGRGGSSLVSRATGISRTTICEGKKELRGEKAAVDGTERVRHPGGGRPKQTTKQQGILAMLQSLVDPATRGDPESLLKWTSKSTRHLASAMQEQGYDVSHAFVGYTLKEDLEYTLQGNKKTREGSNHPDRNAQFEKLNEQCKRFEQDGCPMISVDTKKKENVGNLKNNGKEDGPKGRPAEVNGHDFPDKQLGQAAPYGVDDMLRNKGWVSIGVSADTARFAVNSIRSWWYAMGKEIYAGSDRLLVTADCGGSNGYKNRLWKVELQKLANELKMAIHVAHFPPGTSKWNKIEQRMFSFISQNWRGKPLIDYVTIVNLIGSAKTKKGLEIKACLDKTVYEKGIKISDREMAKINIIPGTFHGEWNYRILPQID